jgi:hypothetical protein
MGSVVRGMRKEVRVWVSNESPEEVEVKAKIKMGKNYQA